MMTLGKKLFPQERSRHLLQEIICFYVAENAAVILGRHIVVVLSAVESDYFPSVICSSPIRLLSELNTGRK